MVITAPVCDHGYTLRMNQNRIPQKCLQEFEGCKKQHGTR